MSNQYGPWATLIDAGGNPQLSAFWRRRLTMLVPTSQTSPVLSRRNLLWLGAAAVLTGVLPTFRLAPAEADEPAGKPAKTQAKAEKDGPKPWKLPNGATMWESGGTSAAPFNKEMYKLIAEKKYKFVKIFEDGQGEKQYVYGFNFSDGSYTQTNFSMPLDNVTSWEDYQRKVEAQRQQRHEKINRAIAAGRFRLLNVEVMQVHLCRDVASKQKFKVQRIPRADGSELAFPRPDYGPIPPAVQETSWKEHLLAIREGKRELLSSESVNSYTYEMLADDGTKILFNYGGNEPLKKPGDEASSNGPTAAKQHASASLSNVSTGIFITTYTGDMASSSALFIPVYVYMALNREDTRKELKVTGDQEKKLRDIARNYMKRHHEALAGAKRNEEVFARSVGDDTTPVPSVVGPRTKRRAQTGGGTAHGRAVDGV